MRIFLKIFLTFWLTVVLIAVAVGWVGYQFRGEVESHARLQWMQLLSQRQRLWAALETQGPAGARAWLAASPFRGRFFVVDRAGRELLGRALPPFLRARTQLPDAPFDTIGPWSKTGYRILLAPPRHPLLGVLFHRPGLLSLAFAVSALVAALLARHFSSPIDRLRLAASRLAQGELAARAGPLSRRLRDELSTLTVDFDRMAERLEGLVAAHRRLLQDVSHELRTPLARMRIALAIEERSPEAVGARARIEQEVNRLEQLVGQILDVSRLEGEQVVRDVWVDLPELVDMVVRDADFEAEPQGKDVRFDRPATDAVVLADDRLLRAALENVIRNGVRHTPPGTSVEVGLKGRQGSVEIRVRDHGAGVPLPLLADIFKPFFRVDDARDRRSGGYGLGLAIAARAVRAHGGEIHARNHPAGGLEIAIELPLA
ncbi:MAG: ATP-binding protein [Betaproteobacteria bacterium]|nr:ATP-binding protein [Betaproteobacteria bacterium]